jgi:uncharacterized protein YkwD
MYVYNKRNMYRITNLLLLLVMISLFLPASAIIYTSGSPQNSDNAGGSSSDNSDESDNDSSMDDSPMDNNDDESDTWSMEKSNNALDSESMDDSSMDDSFMDDSPMDNNDDESDTWSMEKSNNALNPSSTGGPTGTNNALNPSSGVPPMGTNNALNPSSRGGYIPSDDDLSTGIGDDYTLNTSSSVPTGTNNALRLESNSTKIAYCESCNNDIYNGGGDLESMVLAVHNRERAVIGVPPLVWNDTLAIGAKTWAEHLATLQVINQSNAHSSGYVPGYKYGESIATGGHNTTVPVAQNMQSWIAEKNNYHGGPITETNVGSISHYTMMVWRTTTSVGCGIASGGPNDYTGRDILVCRYSPGPTHGGGNVFGENPY